MNRRITQIAAALLLCVSAARAQSPPVQHREAIARALASLPGYTVFDFLTFDLSESGVVTLSGAALNPALRQQAEAAIRTLPGVSSIKDAIGVLPRSALDDQIRTAVYNAIYKGPVPSVYEPDHAIHIIVKDREVTLEGSVRSQIDRTLLSSAAAGVGGILRLTDHLTATADDSPDAQWRRNLDVATASR